MGSLGPLSQEAPILGFDQHQIPVIWGSYEPHVVVALETFAENPKTAGSKCVSFLIEAIMKNNMRIFVQWFPWFPIIVCYGILSIDSRK